MFRFDPYSPAVDADPFPYYKTLRDEHPCFWSEDANMWVLSRYGDIVRALNDWETYSSAEGNLMDELPNRAGATLGTTNPPYHDQLRGLIQYAFSKRNLSYIEDHIREASREAIAGFAGQSKFDFVEDFSSKVTVKGLFRLLGLPAGDDTIVRDKAVLMVQSDPKTRQKGADHVAAYQWMQDYAGKIIAERKANPGEDLISQFALAEVDGRKLQDREVLLTTTTLIMAGIESLGGFMAMFALNMADYPEARRQCVANPALLEDAIEESLRFNTSAQRFRRCVKKDTELHGQTMRARPIRLPRLRFRQPRRAPVPQRRSLRHLPQAARPSGLRRRGPRLPWRVHRQAGRAPRLRRVPQGHPGLHPRGRAASLDAVHHVPQPDAA